MVKVFFISPSQHFISWIKALFIFHNLLSFLIWDTLSQIALLAFSGKILLTHILLANLTQIAPSNFNSKNFKDTVRPIENGITISCGDPHQFLVVRTVARVAAKLGQSKQTKIWIINLEYQTNSSLWLI